MYIRLSIDKRTIRLIVIVVLSSFCISAKPIDRSNKKPNFIIIYTDDQGYNDVGVFGSSTIKTPNLDGMAKEGLKLTSFYAQTVCGPSRGALMTARYPTRIGGGWRVNSEETMIPEILQAQGYATGCVGKWDMSERAPKDGMVPNDQGFDYFFGTLGANDNGRVEIYQNRKALYITHDMAALTRKYTDKAMDFIDSHKGEQFFLYLAYSMPHSIIDATDQFKGRSKGGLYGDVIEEIDWNVGRIITLLQNLNLDSNTYVLFASDNGPWTSLENQLQYTHGGQLATGSARPLRSSKGSVYEGGFRVPAIFWGPGRIPKGLVKNGIMSTLDILPTFAKLAGGDVPKDRVLDGFDQTDFILQGESPSNREVFFYYIGNELQAVRQGKWKLVLPKPKLEFSYANDPYRHEPELYDLENDISEQNNLKGEFPQKVAELSGLAEKDGVQPQHGTHIYATPRK